MNICLVSTGYWPEDGGGIGTYVRNIAHGLSKVGHRVWVVTKGSKDEVISDGEICVYRFRFRYFPKVEKFFPGLCWSFFVAGKLRHLRRQFHFDVIEFPNWEGVGFVYLLLFSNRGVVTRLHTALFETFQYDFQKAKPMFADRFVFWIEKQAVKKSLNLLASTDYHRNSICINYQIELRHCEVIHLGIDVRVDFQKGQKFTKEFKVLTVGRMEYLKGTIYLLDAISEILKEVPDVHFTFIGNDRPHAPGHQSFVRYFQSTYPELVKKVKFCGFMIYEEALKEYEDADLFVLPSLCENFGLVFVEAMSYGVPVVAFNNTAVPEVVKDGVTGYLVPDHDKEKLVEAILRLLKDDSLRQQMSQNALDWVEKQFDQKQIVERTINYYKKVTTDLLY